MNKATIRQAKPGDAFEISAVIHQGMEQYAKDSGIPVLLESLKESESDVERFIRDDLVLIARVHDHIIGTIRVSDCSEQVARISRFSVLPSTQKSGIGNDLFCAAEAHIRKSGYQKAKLYTATTNPKTVRFYTARGYRLVRVDTDPGYPRGTFIKEFSP
jgi:N-acetylglutamate synthase-like GNAT family acetyltransferase